VLLVILFACCHLISPFLKKFLNLSMQTAGIPSVKNLLRYNSVVGGHKLNLTPNVEMMGVTSVAGFR
jgi:hypothetical protein